HPARRSVLADDAMLEGRTLFPRQDAPQALLDRLAVLRRDHADPEIRIGVELPRRVPGHRRAARPLDRLDGAAVDDAHPVLVVRETLGDAAVSELAFLQHLLRALEFRYVADDSPIGSRDAPLVFHGSQGAVGRHEVALPR